MFSERFDALMSIAEVSNTLLGRAINMDGSHIGRFRTGARPLPKKHVFLTPMCLYLAGRITKDYQINALQKLTGMSLSTLSSKESIALFLEQWLTEQEKDTSAATGRLISGFSRLSAKPAITPIASSIEETPSTFAQYLYGNAGKRKAVEQLFFKILQEDQPQTILLFTDENITWLSEDAAFAAQWPEYAKQVLIKGNRVRVVHALAHDLDYLLWSATNWLPMYMTGAVEPYCFPRHRDSLFRGTMLIAPNTAAVISSSIQQDTNDMLNIFVTDREALAALTKEFERFLALCPPLMQIYTQEDSAGLYKAIDNLRNQEGNSSMSFAMPPLFSVPESVVREAVQQTGNDKLLPMWKRSVQLFKRNIKKSCLSLSVLDPQIMLLTPYAITFPISDVFGANGYVLTAEQYMQCFERLMKLKQQHENLHVYVRNDLLSNMLVYVKEDWGAVMVKTDEPVTGFVTSEKNMIYAFWEYVEMQNKAHGK